MPRQNHAMAAGYEPMKERVSRGSLCRAGELCDAAGCAPSLQSMLGPGGVTDKNLMQYLGILEQRAYEIIQASPGP